EGAGAAMDHRAVRRLAAAPAMALDAALEALALGHADDVDDLAGGEQLDGQRLADLVRLLDLVQPHLAQDARRRDVGLLEVAGARLGDVLLRRLEAELERIVAVGLLAPDL